MQVIPEPRLRERTTLQLGGKALAEIWIEADQDWDRVPEKLQRFGGAPLVLGKGSNILPSDEPLPLVLIRQSTQGPEFRTEGQGCFEVLVQAGQRLAGLLAELKRHALGGLEGLIGIPGTVGGAVVMNAGSYGCTIGECLRRVQFFTPEKGLFWVQADQLQTGYRFFEPSLQTGFWVMTRAVLGMHRSDQTRMQMKMRRLYLQKKATQPVLSRTCGCVFKNPEHDEPAGRLLERCGFRGYRLGNMGFSERHANFLINHGHGRTQEALELIETAREQCRKTFGLELELEVKCIGT